MTIGGRLDRARVTMWPDPLENLCLEILQRRLAVVLQVQSTRLGEAGSCTDPRLCLTFV